MADLPRDRMSEEAPVIFCGVDMFGHFVVKNGRSELKRYGTLYTCFSSSATHIEVTYSLKTKLFIEKIHWSKRKCSLDKVRQWIKLY